MAGGPGNHGVEGEADKESAALSKSQSLTSSNTQDYEELREEARRNNPNGVSHADTGVSVERAEADFAELQRELSRISRASRPKSKGQTVLLGDEVSPPCHASSS